MYVHSNDNSTAFFRGGVNEMWQHNGASRNSKLLTTTTTIMKGSRGIMKRHRLICRDNAFDGLQCKSTSLPLLRKWKMVVEMYGETSESTEDSTAVPSCPNRRWLALDQNCSIWSRTQWCQRLIACEDWIALRSRYFSHVNVPSRNLSMVVLKTHTSLGTAKLSWISHRWCRHLKCRFSPVHGVIEKVRVYAYHCK